MSDKERITQWIDNILNEVEKLDDDKGIELLHQCGAGCCEASQLMEGAAKIRNDYPTEEDPDKLFHRFKEQYYNSPRFMKSGDEITLIFEACTCPMVHQGVRNSFLCNCTVGYSRKIFSTLFDRPVTVDLEQSILRGDEMCKQIIRIED